MEGTSWESKQRNGWDEHGRRRTKSQGSPGHSKDFEAMGSYWMILGHRAIGADLYFDSTGLNSEYQMDSKG